MTLGQSPSGEMTGVPDIAVQLAVRAVSKPDHHAFPVGGELSAHCLPGVPTHLVGGISMVYHLSVLKTSGRYVYALAAGSVTCLTALGSPSSPFAA